MITLVPTVVKTSGSEIVFVLLTPIEKSSIILHMDNKQLTSLKVWKQTQEKLKILAALRRKTMLEVLDEVMDRELKQQREEGKDADQEL
jgi:hypothetical protein